MNRYQAALQQHLAGTRLGVAAKDTMSVIQSGEGDISRAPIKASLVVWKNPPRK